MDTGTWIKTALAMGSKRESQQHLINALPWKGAKSIEIKA